MYEELVKKLSENIKITVKGEEYIVISKAFYTIEEDNNVEYIKCKLNKHKMLVIIPSDELMYIGFEDNNLGWKLLDDENILVNGIKYKKVGAGNQIVKSVEFGEDKYVEKECDFIDYEAEDGKTVISLSVLKENNERSDIIAEIISLDDLTF